MWKPPYFLGKQSANLIIIAISEAFLAMHLWSCGCCLPPWIAALNTGEQLQVQDKILQASSYEGVDARRSQPDIQSTARQCQSVPFKLLRINKLWDPAADGHRRSWGRAALSTNSSSWCASDGPGVVINSGQDLTTSPPWMPSLDFTHTWPARVPTPPRPQIPLASHRHPKDSSECQKDSKEKSEISGWLYCSLFNLSIFQAGNSHSQFAVYSEESKV